MKSFFLKSFRLTFAGALYNFLHEPRSIGVRPSRAIYSQKSSGVDPIVIKGNLPLKEHGETSETIVGLQLLVLDTWSEQLPIASTDAPFLRHEVDWHIPRQGLLCYGLDQEWKWKLTEMWESNIDTNTFVSVASSWCIRNIDSLITRHLYGHRFQIKVWPKEWGQWSHGQMGIVEFESSIRKKAA
jgi:hypothetical protein